jgi:hypothetical protein
VNFACTRARDPEGLGNVKGTSQDETSRGGFAGSPAKSGGFAPLRDASGRRKVCYYVGISPTSGNTGMLNTEPL